jgi:DNA polymerase-3 subunit epsilon
MGKAEAIIAHNGKNFDKVVLEEECKRHGLTFPGQIPWVDTLADVPYPKKIEVRKLEFLAPAHGFLNPFAHRAAFDALAMLKVLSHYDFETVLKRSKEPDVIVRAMVAAPFGPTKVKGEKEVAEAKARGYKFDNEGKLWVKRIKESEYGEEAASAPWQVVIVKK